MIPYYKDRICLNVLAGSLENAIEVYHAAEGHLVAGVLSASYDSVDEAVIDMQEYMSPLDGNLSIGLGAGNPNQWQAVGDICKDVKANHVNQVFTGVAYTRANIGKESDAHINSLVSPSGTPGKVIISTGPLSSMSTHPALVDVDTAIRMVKDMGGNSLKFFPMGGLSSLSELHEVAKACANADFCLEPTGGIDLDNYEEIMGVILDAGVKKIIPHIYSSIIDAQSGDTRVEDVKELFEMTKTLLDQEKN